MSSDLTDNSADDSGGALYLDTGEEVEGILDTVVVKNNVVKGLGGGKRIVFAYLLTIRLENNAALYHVKEYLLAATPLCQL